MYQQPYQQPYVQPMNQPLIVQDPHWKHSIFGCLAHPQECLCLYFCGPFYLCLSWSQKVGEIGHRGCCEVCLCESFICCYPVNRQYIVQKFGIHETCMESCLLWTCCKPCAILQEANEIKDRHVHHQPIQQQHGHHGHDHHDPHNHHGHH